MMFLRFSAFCLFGLAALASGQHSASGAGGAGHGEHHRHHASVFIGGSHHGGDNGQTYGGEYAFRFTRRLSLGVEGEHAGGAFRDEVFTFPFIIDVYKGLKLATGPGFEREVREVTGAEGELEKEKEHSFLYRFGVHYEIPLTRRFSLTPNVAWDITARRTVFVYGVSFGLGF